MKETKISRLLGSSKDLSEVFKDSPVGNILVGCYFLDNLSEKEIAGFGKQNLKGLVILDYLKPRTSKYAVPSFIKYGNNFSNFMSKGILCGEEQEETNPENFSNYEKQIASLAYLSFLKNKESKILSEKSESKDDLKRIYCFDYLFDLLNEKRKSLALNGEDVFETTKNIARLYQGQVLSEEIRQIKKDLEGLIKNVESSDICFDDLLKKSELTEKISKYDDGKNNDYEVKNLLEEFRILTSNAENLLKENTERRFNREYNIFETEFNFLNEKKLLTGKEFKNLEKLCSKTEKLFKLLRYTGSNKNNIAINLLRNERETIKTYNEFKANAKKFDSYKTEMKEIIDKIPKKHVDYKELRFEQVNLISSSQLRIEKINRELKNEVKNKYSSNYLSDFSGLINEFYVEVNRFISAEEDILRKEKQEATRYFDKHKKSLWGFLFLPKANNRIQEIGNYEDKINALKERLNNPYLIRKGTKEF